MTKSTETTETPALISRGETTFTNISGINNVPETGVIALEKDSDGVFTAAWGDEIATAKSKSAAAYALLSGIAGVKINSKLVALESGPMKPVANEKPEYTADEDNADTLADLAHKIDALGDNTEKSQAAVRADIKDIGNYLSEAKAILAVETGSASNAPAAQAWGVFIASTQTLRKYAKSKNAIGEYMRVASFSDTLLAVLTGTSPKNLVTQVNQGYKALAALAVERGDDLGVVEDYCHACAKELADAELNMEPIEAGNHAVLTAHAALIPFAREISDEQFEAALLKAQDAKDAQDTKDKMTDEEKKAAQASDAADKLESHFAGLTVEAAADALWSIVNTHGDTEGVLEAFDALR